MFNVVEGRETGEAEDAWLPSFGEFNYNNVRLG